MIEPIRATKLPQYAVLRAQLHHYEYIAQLAGQLGYESTVEQIHRRLNLMTDGQQYAVYVGEDLAGALRLALDEGGTDVHYGERATMGLTPYSPSSVDEVVARELLPRLGG